MTRLATLQRDTRGASAVEFTLLVPFLMLLIFGTIDVGRYPWNLSQAEKATQTGARWAVATDMIASGLYSYSFAVAGIEQGTTVNSTAFPGISCQSAGGTVACTCPASCAYPTTANSEAFGRLVARMAQIYPGLTANNVVVNYAWSGLGFAGDPNGADVSPLITVSLRNLNYAPFSSFIYGSPVALPAFAYTLPMEDGSGTGSN